jgi:hypothetical protein
MGRLTEQSAMQHEQEIQRRREASAREDLAYRKGFNSVAEMEESKRRATHNATVKQNQQRYCSEQERQRIVSATRARILAGEAVPELVQHLEKNPDLSGLDAGHKNAMYSDGTPWWPGY